MTSNVTFAVGGDRVIYFEGTNVLLKIDGTEPARDGVLFSCHYDSVSSAPGATDDGMGVATLLEMAEYLSVPERRPRRTAVFFFNNGEEDYLNGAHAYFEHPWSNITSVFINVEGAASGGRPLLFRSTSYGPAHALAAKSVRHPHATALTSEAFSRGMIRSATDYEIYARGVKGEVDGLQGFDLAFYKNRAYYHTLRDSIPGMGHGEARKALWAMIETVSGSGLALLNNEEGGIDSRSPVYFDVFGRALIILHMDTLYGINVALLVLGPLSTIALAVWVILAAKKRSNLEGVPAEHIEPRWKFLVKTLLGWERFWVALILTALVHVALTVGFLRLNPYVGLSAYYTFKTTANSALQVVHSHAYAVLSISLALSFLSIVLPLQALHAILPPTFASQKLATTLSLYFFTWLLLVVSTVAISTKHYGFLYFATFLNVGAWFAGVLELVHAVRRRDPGNELGTHSFLFTSPEEQQTRSEGAVPGRRLVRGVLHEVPENHDGAHIAADGNNGQAGHSGDDIVETEPTEITPLIHQHRRRSQGGGEYLTVDPPEDVKVMGKPVDEYGWWIAQALLLVPAIGVLLFQLEVLLLNATMHTLVDGSSPLTVGEDVVYALLALFSTLIFIPIAPFAHKLPQSLNVVVAGLLLLGLAVCWTVFPFTQQWPFRVYFQQSIELASPLSGLSSNPASPRVPGHDVEVVRAETTLTALKGYVDKHIVPDIPSSWHANVACDPKGLRPDLMTCRWPSDLLPSPGGKLSATSHPEEILPKAWWLDVQTTPLNATRALISLRGQNTRGCRLYFGRAITFFYVHPSSSHTPIPGSAPYEKMHFQGGYEMPPGGVKEARLWSSTWSNTFLVEVGWDASPEDPEGLSLSGRAACEYAEYASGLAVPEGGRIPAYEEVKQFLPLWALPTKLADGLVEVWTRFEV
ncbi:hypothetical protein BN946_scf184708.g7 [Trametes cinnabarina]|uniref:Peptide hydrolase n=1 Tax=Pycnoporus cinnabarinus TaxID=5643 RepID=A0A060SZS2_PYCCI|nr:hypothetical protein BN946_scf184708.g7 [Trametes cinnabarina]